MGKLLLIDGSPLMYQQYTTVGFLKTKSGIPTGLRYGFLRAVRAYREKVKPTKVVITWDSKGPVKKAEGRAEYKANRPWSEGKQSMYDQLADLKKMLSLTAFTQVESEGYEADDLIGTLTRQMEMQGHEVVIVSPDHDMLQLLSPKVMQCYTKGKVFQRMDVEWMLQEKNCHPKAWLLMKAIRGDASDNLKGVGVSNAIAVAIEKVVSAHAGKLSGPWYTVEDALKTLTLMGPQECADALASVKDAVNLNMKIMALAEPDTMDIVKGLKDKVALTKLFEELEFKSVMKYVNELCTDSEELYKTGQMEM